MTALHCPLLNVLRSWTNIWLLSNRINHCVLIKKQNLVVDYWWQQKMITDCMLWFQLSGIMCISWLGIIFLKTPMKLCSIWDVNISLTLLQGCMVFTFVIIFQVMSVAQPRSTNSGSNGYSNTIKQPDIWRVPRLSVNSLSRIDRLAHIYRVA